MSTVNSRNRIKNSKSAHEEEKSTSLRSSSAPAGIARPTSDSLAVDAVEVAANSEISLDGLSASDDQGIRYDLFNLAAFNPHDLDTVKLHQDKEGYLKLVATETLQGLISNLFGLETMDDEVSGCPVAMLPPSQTNLPREKHYPEPKPPTRWELFAREKGIHKSGKNKRKFDEDDGEWRSRYGYKKNINANLTQVEESTSHLGGEKRRRRKKLPLNGEEEKNMSKNAFTQLDRRMKRKLEDEDIRRPEKTVEDFEGFIPTHNTEGDMKERRRRKNHSKGKR